MTHALIVPAAIRDACNQAAVPIGIDPEGLLSTLCVPLVPSDGPDDATPTHWGAYGRIPEAAREYLAANLNQFPGAMWWRIDKDGVLEASWDDSDIGMVWHWENSLLSAGLKRQKLPFNAR